MPILADQAGVIDKMASEKLNTLGLHFTNTGTLTKDPTDMQLIQTFHEAAASGDKRRLRRCLKSGKKSPLGSNAMENFMYNCLFYVFVSLVSGKFHLWVCHCAVQKNESIQNYI